MSYRVSIYQSQTAEMLFSLKAFLESSSHKLLDVGAGWPGRVAKLLPAAFDCSVMEQVGVPLVLVGLRPGGDDDPQAFIAWLRDIPLGELYQLVLSFLKDPARIPPDLGLVREQYAKALQIWYDAWFRTLDPSVHKVLADSAHAAAAVVATRSPEEAVERMTGGIVMDPSPDLAEVLLIPQYHFRPFNIFDWSGQCCIIGYPAEVPVAPGSVPADLRNLTRAIADDSRLQILRYLAGGERNFTDVVKFTGLAKSTVHHHMVILRVSGLVRVHMKNITADRYSLRPEAIDSLAPRLHAFLKEE